MQAMPIIVQQNFWGPDRVQQVYSYDFAAYMYHILWALRGFVSQELALKCTSRNIVYPYTVQTQLRHYFDNRVPLIATQPRQNQF